MVSLFNMSEQGGRSVAQPLLPVVAALLALATRTLLARRRRAAVPTVPAPYDVPSVDVPLLVSAQFRCELLHRPRPGRRAPFVSLHTVSWQLTDSPAKGVTVLLHGLNGHSSHGSNLATAHHLLNNGFHVVALDMEGHGRSSGLRGFLPSIEGAVAGDVLALLMRTRARWPTLPLFLMGNSMGGLSATLAALAVQDSLGADAQFLSGVVLQCPLIRFSSEPSPLLQTLVRVLAAVMPQLPFLPHRAGSQSVLQRKVRAAMEADSWAYTGRLRAGTALALHRAAALAAGRLAEVATPFLVQHGTADALVAHHGSQALIKQAAAKDKTLISYQNAGHNLLNEEPETLAQVRQDYLRWLDERVEASAMSAAL